MKIPTIVGSLCLFTSLALAQQRQVLFLTTATPTSGDIAVSNHLAALGFTVIRVADTASQTSDADGKALIVVSSSVASGNIGTKFTASPVPIIDCESAIYDELGMDASNTGGATLTGSAQINIVDCTHPLAAALPNGPVTVLIAAGPLVLLGTPVASARVIATLNDDVRPSIFAVEAGDALLPARIATAPARRVGMFWEATTFMTPEGLSLFDAAIAWATAVPTPPNARVGFVTQPSSVSTNEFAAVRFTIGFTGAAPNVVQWQRNSGTAGFTNIPGATCPTYVIPAARASDTGARFQVVVSNNVNAITSTVATLVVATDNIPPRLLSAVRNCTALNQITLTFDEAVDGTSATEPLFYTINESAIGVSSIVLAADRRTVTLAATTAIPDGVFNFVTAEGVTDLAGNTVAPTKALVRLPAGRSPAGNVIVVEAENFDANTPASDGHFWIFQNAAGGTGTFSGTGYVRALPDSGAAINEPGHTVAGASPRLDYCISFPTAGLWLVWLRGNDIATGGNSCHIGLDGTSPDVSNYRIGNTGGASGWGDGAWKWTRDANDSTSTFAAVNVPTAGVHTLNLWMREDGIYIDKILLTTDSSFVFSQNTDSGPGETPLIDSTPVARLNISRSGNTVRITSNVPAGAGRLQQTDNIGGSWSNVAGADPSNYTVALTNAARRYYRFTAP